MTETFSYTITVTMWNSNHAVEYLSDCLTGESNWRKANALVLYDKLMNASCETEWVRIFQEWFLEAHTKECENNPLLYILHKENNHYEVFTNEGPIVNKERVPLVSYLQMLFAENNYHLQEPIHDYKEEPCAVD